MRCVPKNSRLGRKVIASASKAETPLPARGFSELEKAIAALGDSSAPIVHFSCPPTSVAPERWAQHLVDALLQRLITRFPKPGQRCPLTGLNRNQLYELASKKINGKPAIETLSLQEEGERGGARFFLVGSALAYLRQLAYQQSSSNPANKKS